MLTVSLKNEVNGHKVGQDNQQVGSKKRTCVADVEAFSGIRVIRLKFQPHDVTIGGDLWWNVFSWESPECRRLRQA